MYTIIGIITMWVLRIISVLLLIWCVIIEPNIERQNIIRTIDNYNGTFTKRPFTYCEMMKEIFVNNRVYSRKIYLTWIIILVIIIITSWITLFIW